MNTNPELSGKIQQIFDDNKLEDLKFFLEKRHCLNATNSVLIYLFHIVQSVGILTTTIAAGYDQKYLIWVGVGLNILASLINVFEQTNNSISKKLMNDINAIKTGNYVDEGFTIESGIDDKNKLLLSKNEISEA
jgi:hypothetical protein